jgi:branched-chain amino acid transport system substrate-binding protein
MVKKIILGVFVLLFLLSGCISGQTIAEEKRDLSIGGVLILSGPAAYFGESIQSGMEVARLELEEQGVTVDIHYEDSALRQEQAVSSFRVLTDIKGVDAVVSMFSSMSVPLVPLAEESEIPLLMTIVAADKVAAQSPYAFRYFFRPDQYARIHFETQDFFFDNISTLAILYRNDEFGVSVEKHVRLAAAERNISVVFSEGFEPHSKNYKTELLKIKTKAPEAIFYIPAIASETRAIIEQYAILNISIPLFEASNALADSSLADLYSNRMYATIPLSFIQKDVAYEKQYDSLFGVSPAVHSNFGYDAVMMLAQAHATGDIVEGMHSIGEFNTTNGLVTVSSEGEINPEIFSIQLE